MDKQSQAKRLNEETKKEAKKERKRLIIDFDEAVAEEKAEPVIVKFQGEEFKLPANAPAWLPLFINRNQNDDGVVGDEANFELIERLLGEEFAQRILDAGNFVSFELVNSKILEPVMNHWGLAFEDATGKNGKTPDS